MENAYSRSSLKGPRTASAVIMTTLVENGAQQQLNQIMSLTIGGTAIVIVAQPHQHRPLARLMEETRMGRAYSRSSLAGPRTATVAIMIIMVKEIGVRQR